MIIVKESHLFNTRKVGEVIAIPKIVRLTGDFDEDLSTKFIADVELVMETNQKILPIVIDSYGGIVDSLISIIEHIEAIRSNGVEIVTVVAGKAMSAGAYLFCMGDRRYVGRSSRILFHDTYSRSGGNPEDIESALQASRTITKTVTELCSIQMGMDKGWLAEQLASKKHVDWHLSATQAKRLGIATHIGIPKMEVSIDVNFAVGDQ